jgi:drug/metabolite transporter (DMT)-like permease
LPVVALALGPTALATWLILVIIDRQGASFLSQINFMVPLFGVFFSAIFLSEVLSLNAWLALGIILIALWLSRTGSRK